MLVEITHGMESLPRRLATISHELRTPLQAILGWSSVQDFLDVSRIITGKLRLAIDEVEVRGIVEAAADTVRAAAGP